MGDWTPDAPLEIGDLRLLVHRFDGQWLWSVTGGKHGQVNIPAPDLAAARLACLRAAEGILRKRVEEAERGLAEVRRRMVPQCPHHDICDHSLTCAECVAEGGPSDWLRRSAGGEGGQP